MKRYLVLAIRKPGFQPSVLDAHSAFLNKLREKNQLELAGGFTDKTGGAYVILASDLAEAEALAFSDPVHTTGSSTVTVQEWNAH